MWISKGVKSFFQKGWWSRQFFQQDKGFFLQAMLYNAQLGGSRTFISKGRGNNQENSFPQGVNIIPDGAKQLS